MGHSHLGTIPDVKPETYAFWKIIANNAGAGNVFYCQHTKYYRVLVTLDSLFFQYKILRATPTKTADEIDFDVNFKGAGIQVG